MAANITEKNLNYLLAVLATAAEFRAGYQELAQLAGLSTGNDAQKKFKAVVEKSGVYKLVNGKVVQATPGTTTPATPSALATPKKRKTKDGDEATPKTPASKRSRKKKATPVPSDDEMEAVDDLANQSDDDE